MVKKVHKSKAAESSPKRTPFFQKKQGEGDSFDGQEAQTKLKVGQAGGHYEVEADRAADQVTSGKQVGAQPQISPIVQRKEMGEENGEKNESGEEVVQRYWDEESVQRMEDEDAGDAGGEAPDVQLRAAIEEDGSAQEPTENVQTKPVGKPRYDLKKIAALLKASKGQGDPLPEATQAEMEAFFRYDLSDVRIHVGPNAVAMNKALGAQAFAHQGDIYFNVGKYDPDSEQGKHLLAHELTHTIQQGAIKKPVELAKERLDLNENTATEVVADPVIEQQGTTAKKSEESTAEIPVGKLAKEPAAVPEGVKEVVVSTTPKTPEDDPNFQALKERAEATGKQQQVHPEAKSVADNAGAAAPATGNEEMGEAQAKQVDELERQKPQLFNAEQFAAKLLAAIEDVLPKTEDQADEFPKSGKMDKVKGDASEQVKDEKKKTGKAIEEVNDKEPDTSTVPSREVSKLEPPTAGKKPAELGAGKATPPQRTTAEVEQPIAEETQGMDNAMAEAGVTDAQLEKSEEPTFQTALKGKGEAKAQSTQVVSAFRTGEQGQLEKDKSATESTGKEGIKEMHGGRQKLIEKAAGQQKDSSQEQSAARKTVSEEINRIYTDTQTEVTKKLEGIDKKVDADFASAVVRATMVFENSVAAGMAAYKKKRYGGSWGAFKAVGDFFTGLPEEVNKVYVAAKEVYIAYMKIQLITIATYIANELKAAKKLISDGRQSIKTYVDGLSPDLQKYGQSAADAISDKFDQLEADVVAKQDSVIDSLAQKYKESLENIDARIEELKEANKGILAGVFDAIQGVIDTILKLKQMISEMMASLRSLIDVIMADPLGFMRDLFAGIQKGIDDFSANITNHLTAGLFEWLTGSLGPIGITIPENLFSLSGIFDLLMQVLGVGWDFLRKKLVKLFGEKMVTTIEKAFGFVVILREKGIMGMWEYMKEQFTDLKETVIGAIREMLITQVIKAGVNWLLSLLIPGAGFIKAIMAIKDVVVFFVESAIVLIPALTEAIKAAAAKNFAGIAKAMEFGLGKLIPIVIGLLARLLGIGGLAKKVQKIIKNIRKRIDKQVDKIVKKIKTWVKGKFKGGKKGKKGKTSKKDEKKHQVIAKSVVKKLEKVDQKGSFEEVKADRKKLAKKLEAKHQKKLEKGIKIKVLFNDKKSDAEDGDIDFNVRIAPNTTDLNGEIKTEKFGKLEVGLHPLKGDNRESHHLPENRLVKSITDAYDGIAESFNGKKHLEPLGSSLIAKSRLIKEKYPNGNNLPAILIKVETHRKRGGKGVHNTLIQDQVKSLIENDDSQSKINHIYLSHGSKDRTLAKVHGGHWNKLLLTHLKNDDKRLLGAKIRITGKSETSEITSELNSTIEKMEKRRKAHNYSKSSAKISLVTLIRKVVLKIKRMIGDTVQSSILTGITALKVALKENNDGSSKDQSKAINKLKDISKSVWTQGLAKKWDTHRPMTDIVKGIDKQKIK